MAILFVASEALELKPFASRLTALRKLNWPVDYASEGILEGKRVVLAANGAGPKLAQQAVETALRAVSAAELSASRLEAVVSTGFCGALDPVLRELQIVLGTAIKAEGQGEDTACAMIFASPDGFATGPVLSLDRVVGRVEDKQKLAQTGAIAVEMESRGAVERTQRAGMPFFCIKVVTDRADESFAFDINGMRTSEGRISRGKIVGYTLTHPGVLPQIMRLKKRAENAAEALGEFLVSCRILPESDSTLPE